jgi:2-C-methyl-D-erythritol 4-phosphate cytidylyltransferase
MIVAGGSGIRMKAGLPKQFLLLGGVPVLMHTVQVFYRYDPDIQIIVVLPASQVKEWERLCLEYAFSVPHKTGIGGDSRFHSVQKNLNFVPDHCLVAVHDGVRPLVSRETIERCFSQAERYGNAVPCVEIPESMRMVFPEGNKPADRTVYRLIQTPQVFKGVLLRKAYEQSYRPEFTDDASVVECLGEKIHLVHGNPENIKITLPHDLKMAEALLGDQYHL